MSKGKGLSEETKNEFNAFVRQLNKDLTNLMELLRKQDKDNKAILYAGRHIQKIILPVEEYQKMCKRLDAIDNVKPSDALECLEKLVSDILKKTSLFNTIKKALIKSQEQEKVLEIIKEKPQAELSLIQVGKIKTYEEYLKYVDMWESYYLDRVYTQEEFDLLKRYFNEQDN